MDTQIYLKDMRVDMSYQRIPKEKRVKEIASNWDDNKANIIHVSHRPDGYYVMDGNHTRLAFESIGGEKLLCRVYEGLTVKEEASIFSELNISQKKPSFPEIIRAEAVAGKEPAKSYFQLLDDVGIEYVFDRAAHGCVIKCHSALYGVYKKTTYQMMLRALTTAKKAADGREGFYQVGIFPGLCSIVIEHPELSDEHLIERVKKHTSSQVREIADRYRIGIGGGNGLTTYYRKAFVDIYNKGKKKNRIKKEEEV